MEIQTVTSAIDDREREGGAGPGGDRAGRGGRADHQAEHQQRAHDRHGHRGRERHHDQEVEVGPAGGDAAGLGHLGQRAGQHERAERHPDGDDGHDPEQQDRQHLALADPEHLAEQQRVGLLGVLAADADEQRAEPEHEHQPERGHHVVASLAALSFRAEGADAEGAADREDRQAPQHVDAEQAGAGRAGERAVRYRVGRERLAAQHREEPDHARDHGDDGRGDPGVQHQAGEHSAPSCGERGASRRGRFT